jgi:hypothetical protein
MRRYHQAMKNATVDNVSGAYADKGAKITIRPSRTNHNRILIEGDELAFEFLGKLFERSRKRQAEPERGG